MWKLIFFDILKKIFDIRIVQDFTRDIGDFCIFCNDLYGIFFPLLASDMLIVIKKISVMFNVNQNQWDLRIFFKIFLHKIVSVSGFFPDNMASVMGRNIWLYPFPVRAKIFVFLKGISKNFMFGKSWTKSNTHDYCIR